MRVLVTRPPGAAERTAERLAALGHEALIAPVLITVRTSEPPPGRAVDGILLTSANAAPALRELGAIARTATVFAVGRRTAQAAADEGCRQVATADGDAAALARLVAARLPAGAALLHVAGRDRKSEPAASLESAGFRLTTWTAYEARPAGMLAQAVRLALAGGTLGAALHYSRRSATVLLDLAGQAGLSARLLALGQCCLSEDVATPLRAAGARHIVVAARPDEDALLAGLDRSGPAPSGSP